MWAPVVPCCAGPDAACWAAGPKIRQGEPLHSRRDAAVRQHPPGAVRQGEALHSRHRDVGGRLCLPGAACTGDHQGRLRGADLPGHRCAVCRGGRWGRLRGAAYKGGDLQGHQPGAVYKGGRQRGEEHRTWGRKGCQKAADCRCALNLKGVHRDDMGGGHHLTVGAGDVEVV